MDRTEEEKIVQAGVKVILGGREYFIRPLVIKYSGEWRKKSVLLVSFLIKFSEMDKKLQGDALTEFFTTKTDEILDSFFEYARELDRKEIEEIATDGEILMAFMEVFTAFVSPLSVAAKMKAMKGSR
ncbi:MAG: hypothetical protein KAR06_05015 [Deltaproteobacteria bacterium]|nr:hypothetical protein [Deltaproteobacteria bacterium]